MINVCGFFDFSVPINQEQQRQQQEQQHQQQHQQHQQQTTPLPETKASCSQHAKCSGRSSRDLVVFSLARLIGHFLQFIAGLAGDCCPNELGLNLACCN